MYILSFNSLALSGNSLWLKSTVQSIHFSSAFFVLFLLCKSSLHLFSVVSLSKTVAPAALLSEALELTQFLSSDEPSVLDKHLCISTPREGRWQILFLQRVKQRHQETNPFESVAELQQALHWSVGRGSETCSCLNHPSVCTQKPSENTSEQGLAWTQLPGDGVSMRQVYHCSVDAHR